MSQVYLPGIDGTGLAASRQFPYLVEAFDLRALSVPSHDRTPYPDLVRLIMCAVLLFYRAALSTQPGLFAT